MPFIPFIMGAVVGSAVTYVVKDDSSKEMLKDTSHKITDSASALTGKVTNLFKKATDEVEEVVEKTKSKAKTKAA